MVLPSFECNGMPPRRHVPDSHLELAFHAADDPQRSAVESFVHEVYARRYGANVGHFAPVLVSLRQDGELLAAAGYRNAGDEPLFLERYLSDPIERALAALMEKAPLRSRIVEIGHLTSDRGGAGRRLIQLLAPRLAAQGFEWAVSTVTRELRAMLVRLGAVPLMVAPADPAALGEDTANWGSYYDHQPAVLATHLPRALQRHSERRLHTKGGDS